MTEARGHPDLDALSASLDGEDAERVGPHLLSCDTCRRAREGLAHARDAAAQPVPPLADVLRERAITEALSAATGWGAGEHADGGEGERAAAFGSAAVDSQRRPETHETAHDPAASATGGAPRRRWAWIWSAAAAVAVLVAAAGTLALVGHERGQDTNTALQAGAPTNEKAAGDAALGRASGAAGGTNALEPAGASGDLGDIADVTALRSRVASALSAVSSSAPAAVSSAASATSASANGALNGSVGGAGVGGAAGGTTPPVALVPSSGEVGSRVCEAEARTTRPRLGPVVFAANLRYQGTSAVVLEFAPSSTDPVARLLVLAPAQGCRALAETTTS